ncbi:MAG: hypothetical protein ACXWYE_11880 [Actinomycetota bacterium]
MNRTTAAERAAGILREYARRTGLAPAGAVPARYLWTDAFAVCTFLGLYETTGETACRARALALVEQVHGVLGRHRGDDGRSGWISGLPEGEGARHPTAGGLRIGKPLPERGPGEPADDRLERDRDGQYYHYLTKWAHALCRVSRVTGDPVYAGWAAELVKAVHPAFVPGRRMYWKMSIDLTRPLVATMGQHDPLDGFVTCAEVQAASGADLSREQSDLAALLGTTSLATNDPLGTGGLLFDAVRIAELAAQDAFPAERLLGPVLAAAHAGVAAFAGSGTLRCPAEHRLAFRELGLALGLRGAGRLRAAIEASPAAFADPNALLARTRALEDSAPLADAIEGFWLDERHRSVPTWTDHREINEVTLAACLAPDGFLAV